MSGCRHLANALSKHAATADDVGDLCLVAVYFDSAWPEEVGRRMQIKKLCFHFVSVNNIELERMFAAELGAPSLPSFGRGGTELNQPRSRHFRFDRDSLIRWKSGERLVQGGRLHIVIGT